MRKIFLSLLLQTMPVPALGYVPVSLVSSIYGPGKETALNTVYAPQLQLTCTLDFKESIEVINDRIYLEDLASCDGPAQLCQEALAIELGKSPLPGLQGKFKRRDVLAIVQEEFPQHTFEASGPEQVNVIANGVVVNNQKLKQSFTERLSDQEGPIRFELQNIRSASLMRLRHEDYEISFPSWHEELNRLRQFPRRTMISLTARAEDTKGASAETFEWPVQVTVKAQLLTLVAARSLPRGSPIGEKDVRLDWLPFQENVLRHAKDLSGKTLRMAVREGQVLRPFELMQEPDVRRGEKVEAAIISGGVRMNGVGQAMEAGIVGQKIRVQLDSTKRQMFGTIVAKSLVEVQMP